MSDISEKEMKELVSAWENTIDDVKDYMDKLSDDESAFLSVWLIVCHDAMEEIYHKHLTNLKNAESNDYDAKWDCIDNIFVKLSYVKEQLEGAESALMKVWSAYSKKYPGENKRPEN